MRTGAVGTVENRLGEPPPATFSKGHAARIEAIYRFVYVMATLNRDELLDIRREKELEDLIAAAQKTMIQAMNESAA